MSLLHSLLQRARIAVERRDLTIFRKAESGSHAIRYVVCETSFGTVYLDHLLRPDPVDLYHRHQWERAYSVVLRGGYTERVCLPIVDYGMGIGSVWEHSYSAGEINTLHTNEYHRVISVLPNTWTLLVVGKVSRSREFLPGSDFRAWINLLRPTGELDKGASDRV